MGGRKETKPKARKRKEGRRLAVASVRACLARSLFLANPARFQPQLATSEMNADLWLCVHMSEGRECPVKGQCLGRRDGGKHKQ